MSNGLPPQPWPKRQDGVTIAELVVKDIRDRAVLGIQKYGTPLQPHNGRNAVQDLYEELLDAAKYAKQILLEQGHRVCAHGKTLTEECGECRQAATR